MKLILFDFIPPVWRLAFIKTTNAPDICTLCDMTLADSVISAACQKSGFCPVSAGLVEKEAEYLYSSCSDYYGNRVGSIVLEK